MQHQQHDTEALHKPRTQLDKKGEKRTADKAEQEAAETEREKMMQRGIAYQQFFRSRHHSAYFEVAATPIPLRDTTGDFDKMRKIATKEEATSNTIHEGNRYEINAWLKRTGWVRYLKSKDPKALLALVEEPKDARGWCRRRGTQWERWPR